MKIVDGKLTPEMLPAEQYPITYREGKAALIRKLLQGRHENKGGFRPGWETTAYEAQEATSLVPNRRK